MHTPRINPKRRDNFIPFFFSHGKYTIDESYQQCEVPSHLCTDNECIELLKKALTANFNELKAILGAIEDKINDFDPDLLFSFLYASSLFVGLSKKDQLAQFKGVLETYNSKFEQHADIVKAFFNLKTTTEESKTLRKTSEQIQSKRVVTRFPPEPSGFLHLGHAKAALLNNFFAKENNGTLIVRFDDTNPLKEEQLFVDAITEDLRTLLGIKEFKLSYTSDFFDLIIEYAIKLIERGKAYVDNTAVERMREERMNGVESGCRAFSVEENLKVFSQMMQGEGVDYCLRAKIDMSSLNKALRDPVIYRCVDKNHHRVGSRYKIYPTYDFACPIVDSLENVTYALRTNEYRDRNEQYNWFLRALDMQNKPKIKDFSRLSFENTILSKRKLKNIVETYNVPWDDPRMPTLRGIKRLGMSFDVLKEYILLQGVSQKNCKISWDKIWAMNKKKLEGASNKYFGIQRDQMIEARIENYLDLRADHLSSDEVDIENLELGNHFYIKIFRNKKSPESGSRRVCVSEDVYLPAEKYEDGEEITLMQLGNFFIQKTDSGCVLKYNPGGDFKKTKIKVQWVSKDKHKLCNMVEYGNLCINDEGDFNEDSKAVFDYVCEKNVEDVQKGDVFQLERIGFYYADGVEYNLVPYTKQIRRKE